jgi:hypothetical protein
VLGAHVQGRCSTRATDSPKAAFPLRISDNRRHLVDRRGRPFFVLGDTPWFLQRLRLEDVRRVLDDRKAKGFNTLYLEILDDSHLPSRDAHGHLAFEPGTDMTRPMEAYWRYADTVLEEATKRGFFVIMSDLWYGAGEGLWIHHVTPESAAVYGRFLAKRYAHFQNLMWMHCGDRNPDDRTAECARQLARAFREQAPHQLQTAELAHEFPSAAFFAHESWLDVNMAYTYAASYLQVSREYQRNDPVRPVLLGETGYEDEPNAIELLPDAKRGDLWTPYRIRRNAYWAILSGACGYCAGTRLWRYEPNWRTVLNAESIRQAPLIRRLVESGPWWRLIPDTKHELITAGYGTWGKADYVTAALTDDGSFALAYVPSPRALTLDLTRLRGPAQARWYDPTSGQARSIAKLEHVLTPPGKNACGEDDWVLIFPRP